MNSVCAKFSRHTFFEKKLFLITIMIENVECIGHFSEH